MALAVDTEARVLTCTRLPSLPHVALRLLELTRDPDVTVEEIVACLSTDPALVQKILRTANSPLYGLQTQVSTISKAASLLGLNVLRGLVLGFSLVRDGGPENSDGFSMLTFWRYSLTSAVAARALALRVGYQEAEEAFVGGLLQDIGVLALHRATPKAYAAVLLRRREALAQGEAGAAPAVVANALCRLEAEAIGTDHARVAGALCRRWGLPDVLAVPVRFHHAPAELDGTAGQPALLARILNLADLVGQAYNIAGKRRSLDALAALGRDWFGLEPAHLEPLLEQVANSVNETAKQFEVDIGRDLDYEEILAQANVELVRLTLAAQRSAEKEARHVARAERRAKRLESLNLELAERANRDPLTGVFNRGFFDRFLAKQFERGRASGRSLGLLLMDIHGFKRINDTYGHQQGDAVLIELGRRLRQNTRDCDLVARYGGDEFVVVLPEANHRAVREIAARLRAAVWDQPFPRVDEGTVDVAIGIGAVALSDYGRLQGPGQMLAVADKLLYATKRQRDRKICLVQI